MNISTAFFILTLASPALAVGPGQVKLSEDIANGTNFTAIKAASTISADITYTLPPADGGSSQVLSTDGSGTLSWVDPGTPWAIVTKSSSYSILSSDRDKQFNVTGTTTLTLPSPAAVGAGYRVAFNNSGSNTVTVQQNASETINGANSFTLSANQSAILITDGTNWYYYNKPASSGGGSSCSPANIQVFASSGTWTKPSCGTLTTIQCWGAGGGGGGGNTFQGGGGGGGAFNFRTIATSSLGSTETVTVGAGGAGGVNGANGSAGGNSSFGSWLTVYGGGGGKGASSAGVGAGGGGGGTTSVGAVGGNTTGGNGGTGTNASAGGAGGTSGNVGAHGYTATSATFGGTAADNNDGNTAWTTPSNALTSNNSRASATNVPAGGQTNYLKVSNFGFSISNDATIVGIYVEWEKNVNTTASTLDQSVKLIKGGTITGADKATASVWPVTASEAYVAYGGVNDFWGEVWTPSDINSANFGVAISAKNNSGATRTFQVDAVRVTIYYTFGGGGGGGGFNSTRGGHSYFGGGGGGGSTNTNHAVTNGGNSYYGGGGGGGSNTCCGNNAGGTSIMAGAGGQGSGCTIDEDPILNGRIPAGGGGGGGNCSSENTKGGEGAPGRCLVITN